MRRGTIVKTVITLLVLGFVIHGAPAWPQERTADITTWEGQSFRLTEPVFDLYSTIAPPPREGGALPDAEKRGATAGRGVGLMASAEALKPLFEQRGSMPIDTSRTLTAIPLSRGGVQTSIPIDRIASLTFSRQPVADSSLPPYLAHAHYRYAAVAVLTDGTRVEGDDVNLGLVVIRGAVPQGRVDIPWDRIGAIRFAQ